MNLGVNSKERGDTCFSRLIYAEDASAMPKTVRGPDALFSRLARHSDGGLLLCFDEGGVGGRFSYGTAALKCP